MDVLEVPLKKKEQIFRYITVQDIQKIEQYIQNKQDLGVTYKLQTPLIYAIRGAKHPVVKLLLEHDVNVGNQQEMNAALACAVECN